MDVFTFLVMCAVGFFLLSRLQRLTTKVEPLEKDNTVLRDQLRGLIARVRDLENTLGKMSPVVQPLES